MQAAEALCGNEYEEDVHTVQSYYIACESDLIEDI